MSSTQLNRDESVRTIAIQKTDKPFDIKDWVSSKVYLRGVDYFHDDRVISFELGDDDTIHAEVEGSEIYEVDISWDKGEPIIECTCPYDWEPVCKHAVAAILYWDGEGECECEVEERNREDIE